MNQDTIDEETARHIIGSSNGKAANVATAQMIMDRPRPSMKAMAVVEYRMKAANTSPIAAEMNR